MAISKLKCSECGELKPPTKGFYLSRSKSYINNEGKLPICKDCLNNKYLTYLNHYQDEKKAMYHTCMNFDIYFNEDLLMSSFSQVSVKDSLVGVYIKNVNMPQYKNKSSIHSDHLILDEKVIKDLEDKYKVEKDEVKNKKSVKREITDDIRIKWWLEYSDDECILLEQYYDYYYENYDHEKDLAKLDSLKEICTFKLIIAQAKKDRDNKTIREFSELISKKLTDGDLKPSQRKGYGEQAGDGVGTDIRKIIENEMPVNEVLPQFRDIDNLTKMIEDVFLNPFKKVNGIFSNNKGEKNGN